MGFVHNFFAPLCLPWTWSLATDLQLFCLTQFIFAIYHRFRRPVSQQPFLFLLCLSVAYRCFLTIKFNLGPCMLFFLNYPDHIYSNDIFNHYTKLYISPFTRAGSYFAGVLVGFSLHRKSTKLPQSTPLYAIIILIITIFYPYFAMNGISFYLIDLCYALMGKVLWSFSIGALLYYYNCLKISRTFWSNINNIFLKISDMKLVSIGSNISYCCYLFHALVVLGYFVFTPLELLPVDIKGHFDMIVYYFIPITVISLLVSLYAFLVIEMPFVKLLRRFNKI